MFEITSGIVRRPRKTVIHGEHFTGKSTWANSVGKTLFIRTEDGVNDLDCDRMPMCVKATDVLNQIQWIKDQKVAGEIDHNVVAIDSGDWFEYLLDKALAEERFDMSYGKGTDEIAARFRRMLGGLDMLVEVGISPILICHSAIRRHALPTGGEFDRYEPKLSKKASAVVREWADEILFFRMENTIIEEDAGFGAKRGIGVQTGKREIHTRLGTGFEAKNRCRNLPAKLYTQDAACYYEYFEAKDA